MDPALLETLQKHVEGVVQKSVEAMKVALHDSAVKVQNTLHTTLERIDARFQNQQRHHDDMCPVQLDDDISTIRMPVVPWPSWGHITTVGRSYGWREL